MVFAVSCRVIRRFFFFFIIKPDSTLCRRSFVQSYHSLGCHGDGWKLKEPIHTGAISAVPHPLMVRAAASFCRDRLFEPPRRSTSASLLTNSLMFSFFLSFCRPSLALFLQTLAVFRCKLFLNLQKNYDEREIIGASLNERGAASYIVNSLWY